MACFSNSSKSHGDTTIVNYTIKQGKPLPPNEWHCYNVDQEKVCTPSTWVLIKQNQFLFMSSLNHSDSNSYFVVVKYDLKTSGFNAYKYLKEMYKELKKDSISQFIDYKTTKVVYDDKESFDSELYTSINKKAYTTYSTVFETNDVLFDIALKIESSKANAYKETYKNILFNFYHKNETIFSSKNEIKNVEVVDLSKL